MRLTLKRLLDYGEDRLSPEQTRELGQILAEHPDAAKLVQVLEKAGKGPRVARGEEESRVPLSQLALYLDDRMDQVAETEFEKRAYRDPELLGEIARCHEALSRALPTPTLAGEGDGNEGPASLAWPGGKLSLTQIQSIVNGDGLPDDDDESPPGWKSPYYHLEKHVFDKNPDRFGGLEWENARGWLWRSVFIGICLVALSGALTFYNDQEKWDLFARTDQPRPAGGGADPSGGPKADNQKDHQQENQKAAGAGKEQGTGKDSSKGKERPTDGISGETKKAPPVKGNENKANEKKGNEKSDLQLVSGEGKTDKGSDKKNDTANSKPPVGTMPPVEPGPMPPVEAGQAQVGPAAGTPVDGVPLLMWAKGADPQKLKEHELVSWGREIFVPPGFAGVIDSGAGWKVVTIGNCPSLSGRDLPLGTRFRLEAGLKPGKPALALTEGRVEIIGSFTSPDDSLALRVCGQELHITSPGKFHFLLEVIPRLPRSEETDWTIFVADGAIRLQEHSNDSPALMVAPPGLCQAKHSPLTGISMEKRGKAPYGMMIEAVRALGRFKDFTAAGVEVLSGGKDKVLSAGDLERQFIQPSANLPKRVLLVYLSAWIDDVKLPFKGLIDNRASMKDLREAAVISLGQMSRDRRAAWEKAFLAPAPGQPSAAEAAVPGEIDPFRKLVEAIGKGEFVPALVDKSLELLVDGKSLALREVAYQYLRMVNSPDEGPRYDPAESENARKLAQKEWKRLAKGDQGVP